MRLLLASAAVALLFGLSPASAMCGGGQQAGAGGMCGAKPSANNMTELPDASKAQPEQKQSGMGMGCSCCKNMAMMGGPKSDDPHKGMDMQKQ